MSKCPFWSTKKERVECYNECPLLIGETLERLDSEHCVFNECSEAGEISFRDIIKEEYTFLNLSMYDEERNINY